MSEAYRMCGAVRHTIGAAMKSQTKLAGWQKEPFFYLLPLLVSLVVVSVVYGIHLYKDVPVELMMQDPSAAAGVPVYIGFMSQLGIFFWVAAATSCLFSGLVLLRQKGERRIYRFMLVSGMFCLMLAADDIFMLHEHVIPRAGVPETAVFSFYALAMLTYLVGFFPLLINTRFWLLGISLSFSAVSIVMDLLFEIGAGEDIAKFAALCYWLAYFSLTALQAVEGRLDHTLRREVTISAMLGRLLESGSILFSFNRLK
ncbi:hypothetical protein [Halomonas sp. WWR20]